MQTTDKRTGKPQLQGHARQPSEGFVTELVTRTQNRIDGFLPPQKRAELQERFVNFATANPRLTTFLALNLALTGPPLALFLLFSITILVSSVIVAILVGIFGILLFTGFFVGIALMITLPIVFFTTSAALFVFLWGLAGFYVYMWFNSKNERRATLLNGNSTTTVHQTQNGLEQHAKSLEQGAT